MSSRAPTLAFAYEDATYTVVRRIATVDEYASWLRRLREAQEAGDPVEEFDALYTVVETLVTAWDYGSASVHAPTRQELQAVPGRLLRALVHRLLSDLPMPGPPVSTRSA